MVGDGVPSAPTSPVHQGPCDGLMGRSGDDHPEVMSHLTSAQGTCSQLDVKPLDPCRAQRLKSTAVSGGPRMSLGSNSTLNKMKFTVIVVFLYKSNICSKTKTGRGPLSSFPKS